VLKAAQALSDLHSDTPLGASILLEENLPVAAGIGGGSGRLRRMQTGFVRSYALSMFGGALLVVAALLAVRLGQ
jgi:hypothetical protein